MKIVVFSNLYPPVFIGGYEIGASQIVEELERRGHQVLLLSAHEYFLQTPDRLQHCEHTAEGKRLLVDTGMCLFGSVKAFYRHHPLWCLRKLLATVFARRRYWKAIRDFQPDAFLGFNPLGVGAKVIDDFVAYSRQTGVPVTVFVSDHWLAGWPAANPVWPVLSIYRQAPTRWVRLLARVAGKILTTIGLAPHPFPLIDRYLYCSDFIRQISRENSMGIAEHSVVHWGLPKPERLPPVPAGRFGQDGPLTLLYAGQILEHKGFAVLVRALSRCKQRHPVVVVGDHESEYATACKRLANRLGVLEQITFLGKKTNSDVREFLATAGHILVVPSTWDEPFSIVVLEGMGVGLPVIASKTGGTGEAIADGQSGFLVGRGDFKELAAVIDRLEEDRELCQRVGAKARQTILRRFTMEHMVDQILGNMAGTTAAPLENVAA
jgi:glycosyltransferase involved in cell wall biosynthesis